MSPANVAPDLDLGDGRTGAVRPQPHRLCVRQQRDAGVLERRAHGRHLGVGLGVDEAREAVARGAADAPAERRALLVQHHAARGVERVVPGRRQVVRQPLHPRLVGQRRERVLGAGERFGGVLAPNAMDAVQPLRAGVVRLQVVVADRPCGRDAVVVTNGAEVLAAHAVERGAVELGRAAHEVVDLGLERLPLLIAPRVGRDVAVVHEDRLREPVLDLAGQPVAPLQQQDPPAGRRQVAGEGAAAGAGPDDDHVVARHAGTLAGARARRHRPLGMKSKLSNVLLRLALRPRMRGGAALSW